MPRAMIVKGKSLTANIFETVRDRIVYGVYPPGASLPEKELCREFGVSRTPLREAWLKLQDMKLVTVIPRFGTQVSPIDINEIRCAFEVKTRLEGLAGEMAAERIQPDLLEELEGVIAEGGKLAREASSDRHDRLIEIEKGFHRVIWEAAQNAVLKEFLDNLHYRCARLWSAALSEVVPNRDILDQMTGVYQALKQRDGQEARRRMENHVQYFVKKIKSRLL
ncbi:MAG: GntR family transcriptional regulator [Thermodesulfobacteriota bacterium]